MLSAWENRNEKTIGHMEVCIERIQSGEITERMSVVTHSKASVDSLVAAFCREHRLPHDGRLAVYTKSNRKLEPGCSLRSQGIKSGDVVYLKEKKKEEDLLYFTNWKVLSVLTFVVGCLGVVTVSPLYFLTGGDVPLSYGIVIDAGTTHTEATVYKWPGAKLRGTGEVQQIAHEEILKGLASFKNVREAGESLSTLMKMASTSVPQDRKSTTPVYLGATAGLRVLNLADPEKTEALLQYVEGALQKTGFSIRDVGIISGKDEGLYAWISTNYLSGVLVKQPESGGLKPDTLNALDLGGASAQVALEVPYTASPPDNVTTVKLFGHEYSVFSKSYLCYGFKEGFKRYLATLVLLSNFSSSIQSPCLFSGISINMTGSDMFQRGPCTKPQKTDQIPDDISNSVFTFIGAGNSDQCSVSVQQTMHPDNCSLFYNECFDPVELPTQEKFVAFSVFHEAMSVFKAVNATLGEFEETLTKLCSLNFNQINVTGKYQQYAPALCFLGHFIRNILLDKYGFKDQTWKNLQFVDEINGFTGGWSVGAMVNASTSLPEQSPSEPVIGDTTYRALLGLFLVFILFSILFAVLAYRRRSSQLAGAAYLTSD